MNAIADRLRNRNIPYGWPELADKAADEIERLCINNEVRKAEIVRLRSAPDFSIEWWRKPNGTVTSPAQEEIERLQAKIERLESIVTTPDVVTELRAENSRLQTELARIRGLPRLAALDAKIERLESALRDIASRPINSVHQTDIARAALEGK